MNEMLYQPFGKTGLQVSIIGFGAAPLGNEYGDLDAATGKRAVHAAIDGGVNFFDTSPYYGRTLSETRLGEALEGYRDRVILATKGGRYDRSLPDGFDFSAARLRRSVEESLTRLKTDYIDVYQLHDIEFTSAAQIVDESLPTLYQLRGEGKIRFVGITGFPLPLLQAVAEQRAVDTILSYCHYNLLNTTLNDSLAAFAQAQGIGLISGSSLHMGALTEQGAPEWHPAPRSVHEAAQRAVEVARKLGANLTTLALEFALQNPYVATTLIGMRTEAEVCENLALVGRAPNAEALAAVEQVLAPVKNMTWASGLPENYESGVEESKNA